MLGFIKLQVELMPSVIESLLFNHFYVYNPDDDTYYRVINSEDDDAKSTDGSSSDGQIRTPDAGV